MELVNICVIIVCSITMIVWALRKRFEINTMSISFSDDMNLYTEGDTYELEAKKKQKIIMKDSAQLEYVSVMLQDITMTMISRIKKYLTIVLVILSIIVWYFFEENSHDIAQAIYFFLGAYSQLFICSKIFSNYRVYDPRIIFLSR